MVEHAFVLAGGASTRFGGDKASFLIDGRPMVLHVVEALRSAGLQVRLVVRNEDLKALGVPLLFEPLSEGHYPLRGLLAGLETLKPNESALFAPCDLPFLTGEAISTLAQAPAPSVAFDGERIHPLLGHYAAAAQDRLRMHMAKNASAMAFAEDAHRVGLAPELLRNINRPEDLDSV
jgi:molybdopterin-guanine dinucleotide biosynthesis protein A